MYIVLIEFDGLVGSRIERWFALFVNRNFSRFYIFNTALICWNNSQSKCPNASHQYYILSEERDRFRKAGKLGFAEWVDDFQAAELATVLEVLGI